MARRLKGTLQGLVRSLVVNARTDFPSVRHFNLISNGPNMPELYVGVEQHVTINSNGDITAATYKFTIECQQKDRTGCFGIGSFGKILLARSYKHIVPGGVP